MASASGDRPTALVDALRAAFASGYPMPAARFDGGGLLEHRGERRGFGLAQLQLPSWITGHDSPAVSYRAVLRGGLDGVRVAGTGDTPEEARASLAAALDALATESA
jgi:hypothetical protein